MDDNARRTKAWETRRQKYGPRGHNGMYSRLSITDYCNICPARKMIIRLYKEGTLSEGQASKAACMDRISLRIAADAMGDK